MDKFVQHCLSRLSVYEDTKEMPRKLFLKKQKTSMFLKPETYLLMYMQLQSIIFKTGWQAEIQLFYVKLKFRKNVVIFLTVSINIDWLLSCLMKMRVKCCVFCHHKGHSCYVNIVVQLAMTIFTYASSCVTGI